MHLSPLFGLGGPSLPVLVKDSSYLGPECIRRVRVDEHRLYHLEERLYLHGRLPVRLVDVLADLPRFSYVHVVDGRLKDDLGGFERVVLKLDVKMKLSSLKGTSLTIRMVFLPQVRPSQRSTCC